MLRSKPMGFADCEDIWSVRSLARLQKLYKAAREQTRLGAGSPWNLHGLPPSYLLAGYCSAALKSFLNFLIESAHKRKLLDTFQAHQGNEDELAKKLNNELRYPRELLENLPEREGKETVRLIKTRVNQAAFREIILQVYNNTCCITGIDLPQVNRASHIIPWSESKATRMDPRNGLCLSATYDAAFDRHLISLDDTFRLLVSRDIKDFYTSESVRTYFVSRHGQRIALPSRLKPRGDLLETHRNHGRF